MTELGIRWPAEWEPQQAVWLAWPHHEADWPERFGPIAWVYADFVAKLSRVIQVHLIVNISTRPDAVRMLERFGADAAGVTLEELPTNRVWTRDFCPIWVGTRQNQRAVKWQFNAWAKYDNWQDDEDAGRAIAGADALLAEHQGRRVVLEGGGIEGNGAGTMLTTRECFLSDVQCRNPGFTRETYEAVFAKYLGIRKTIWLNRGIAGDDTHGHIDDLARFVNPTTVLCVYESDACDENHEPTRENLEILRAATNADGRPLDVIPLPMPAPIVFDGQRLPASYANFLITNRTVFVPTFNDPADRHALTTLTHCFPDRSVVGIHCGDFIWGLGTLHCMTMQRPAAS
jgi:agmatine deiminase